jgi:hypothetical protein
MRRTYSNTDLLRNDLNLFSSTRSEFVYINKYRLSFNSYHH